MENSDKILKIPELLPGTSFHVKENVKDNHVKFENMDEMIYFIRAHTGLDYTSIKVILENIYQELKDKILQGENFNFGRLGVFYKRKNGRYSSEFKLKPYLKNGMKPRKFMLPETIENNIENASYEALITYVSMYRNFRVGKKICVQCMLELDRRRSLGDNTEYEKDIEVKTNLIKSIGKGFIIRINENFNLVETLKKIEKITPAFVFNENKKLIHVGIIDKPIIDNICSLEEAEEFDCDKIFIERFQNEIRF